MLRFCIGSLLVALVLWVWSTAFYVISPIPYFTMSETADDLAAGVLVAVDRAGDSDRGPLLVTGQFMDRQYRIGTVGHGGVFRAVQGVLGHGGPLLE